MKRITLIALAATAALLLGISPTMAAKPDGSDGSPNVIERSNGFPSGEHFNLNIHGKKDDGTFVCDPTPGGNSIFIDLYSAYGETTIQYVTNKKSGVTELIALDPCATDDGTAKVQIPYEADGYYVFGRILAKPGGKKHTPVSSIILYPNEVVAACNDTGAVPAEGEDPFSEYTDCEGDLALGLIVGENLYTALPETYVRFDPGTTSGKGRSKATDITRLFTYTGWVVDERLDIYPAATETTPAGDGAIDQNDVPSTLPDGAMAYDLIENGGDNDGFLDIEEWLAYNADLTVPMAWYFDGEWILNIADLVITEMGLVNDGAKLLQVRFYPVDTTTFTPAIPEPEPET